MKYKLTDSFIGWVIKIATVVVNAPATYGLAYSAFETIGDGQPLPQPIRVIVALAAVVLLEGILLQAWQRLDAERAKQYPDPGEEFRHAFKAVAMYFALVAVAFLHGEGLEGVIFRLAFGIQLGISAWDSISREIKQATMQSKTGTRDWVVAGVQRRLMRKTQIYELRQFWGNGGVERFRREQDAILERTRIEVDTDEQKRQLSGPKQPVVAPIVVTTKEQMQPTSKAVDDFGIDNTTNDNHKPVVATQEAKADSPFPTRPVPKKG